MDCFKFGNHFGIDAVLEALKPYWSKKKLNIEGHLFMTPESAGLKTL